MSKPIIAVTGATGAQGGALVRSVIRHGQFAVRAFTRNTDSDKAKALRSAGADVVKFDLDGDASSIEAALKGAKGAFLMTNFWEHRDNKPEEKQAKKFIDAAKRAGVEHLVFSGLEDVEKLSGGRLKCAYFCGKGRVEEYLPTAGLQKYTIVRIASYADSIIVMGQKQDDGSYLLTVPMGPGDEKLHVIAVEDSGDSIHSVFANPDEYNGKTIGISGDYVTVADIAAAMSRASNKTVRYETPSPDQFRKLGFPFVNDFADMFQFYLDQGEKMRDVALTRKLHPSVQTFEQFLANNKDKLDSAVAQEAHFMAWAKNLPK